ncbi:MAG TPA: tetratricopeptide repeat protein [Bryobacteraceae bacterium]|nr:tetratricopeptide repeat protein [Bryobacteraceae bacterium]
MLSHATVAAVAALFAAAAPAQKAESVSFEQVVKQAGEARDQNRLEDAARLYREALRIKPGWPEGWWFLGTLLYDQDRFPECSDALGRLIDLKPEMGLGQALLGLCEFNIQRYASALRHLLEAERLGFGGEQQLQQVAVYHAALACILLQDYEHAREQLIRLVQSTDVPPDVYLAAGMAALRRPLLPPQIPDSDRDLAAQLGHAVVFELERHPEEAARAYEAVLAVYPKAPGVHYTYGSFLLSSDPDKALAALKQELEIDPDHVPALATIAGEYLKREDAASARPYAEKAARLAPGDFAARTAYGRTLLQLDDVEGAIRELETAVKLAPDSPHARFALAAAYTRAGRKEDAETERNAFKRLQKLIDSEKN